MTCGVDYKSWDELGYTMSQSQLQMQLNLYLIFEIEGISEKQVLTCAY